MCICEEKNAPKVEPRCMLVYSSLYDTRLDSKQHTRARENVCNRVDFFSLFLSYSRCFSESWSLESESSAITLRGYTYLASVIGMYITCRNFLEGLFLSRDNEICKKFVLSMLLTCAACTRILCQLKKPNQRRKRERERGRENEKKLGGKMSSNRKSRERE